MAAQRAEVERVFEDPQVSEQWSKLVEWLDRYGAYWRDETLSLVTRVELLASAVLRAAERTGVDVHVVAQELCKRVHALLASRNVQPELVEGLELKGMRKEVAELVAAVFPRLLPPGRVTGAEAQAGTTAAVAPAAVAPESKCPECGSPLVHLKTLNRRYCFTCKRYR
jgi:hypothetical protein